MRHLRRDVSKTTLDGWIVSTRPRLFQRRRTARRRLDAMVAMMDTQEAARREVVRQAFEDCLLYGVVVIRGGSGHVGDLTTEAPDVS